MGQLKIVCAQLGPIDTNTYILMDDEIKEAIIIDPAGSPEELIKFLEDEGYMAFFLRMDTMIILER